MARNPLIYDAYLENGGTKNVLERKSDGTLKKKSLTAGEGGGGGSADSPFFVIHFTFVDAVQNYVVADKTLAEMNEAFTAGKILLGVHYDLESNTAIDSAFSVHSHFEYAGPDSQENIIFFEFMYSGSVADNSVVLETIYYDSTEGGFEKFGYVDGGGTLNS